MPIPQVTRVNPLDLQGNIAIGISLPFNGPAGPFNSTYSTQDQIKSNLINLLLTDKGERIMNPEFGSDIKRALFESITDDLTELIKELITYSVDLFIPGITILSIEVSEAIEYAVANTVSITIKYKINTSGTPDQITIQFI